MSLAEQLLEYCKRIEALSEIGLTYAGNPYEIERNGDLRTICHEMMGLLAGQSVEAIDGFYLGEREYKTPQVDVRAVVFDDRGRLLMIREKVDGRWSLPGGWADVGFAPSEIAVKECKEESGLDVRAQELIAVFDKRCHPHPPQLNYVYKLFIRCELLGGEFRTAFDTLGAGFFAPDEIPPLSEDRVTRSQIDMLFARRDHPGAPALFD